MINVYDANHSYAILKQGDMALSVQDACESWYCLRWECHNAPSLDPKYGFEREVGRLLYRAERKAEADWLAGTPA